MKKLSDKKRVLSFQNNSLQTSQENIPPFYDS